MKWRVFSCSTLVNSITYPCSSKLVPCLPVSHLSDFFQLIFFSFCIYNCVNLICISIIMQRPLCLKAFDAVRRANWRDMLKIHSCTQSGMYYLITKTLTSLINNSSELHWHCVLYFWFWNLKIASSQGKEIVLNDSLWVVTDKFK